MGRLSDEEERMTAGKIHRMRGVDNLFEQKRGTPRKGVSPASRVDKNRRLALTYD